MQSHMLNFFGRSKEASVKNFLLVDDYDDSKVYMLMGKMSKHVFSMDVHYPMSLFQAFAICLSSFDSKLLCEWWSWDQKKYAIIQYVMNINFN